MNTVSNTKTQDRIDSIAIFTILVLWALMMLAIVFVRNTKAEPAQGLDSATPYTRYARPVRPACGTTLVFEDIAVSKGGGTYSEMVLYVGINRCMGSKAYSSPIASIAPVVSVDAVEEAIVAVVAVEAPVVVVVVETPEAPATPETPVVVITPEPAVIGNPGNTKPVGHAGEDPNGQGTMPLDSTDGNGQHGNQGQGGNGNNPNK